MTDVLEIDVSAAHRHPGITSGQIEEIEVNFLHVYFIAINLIRIKFIFSR